MVGGLPLRLLENNEHNHVMKSLSTFSSCIAFVLIFFLFCLTKRFVCLDYMYKQRQKMRDLFIMIHDSWRLEERLGNFQLWSWRMAESALAIMQINIFLDTFCSLLAVPTSNSNAFQSCSLISSLLVALILGRLKVRRQKGKRD